MGKKNLLNPIEKNEDGGRASYHHRGEPAILDEESALFDLQNKDPRFLPNHQALKSFFRDKPHRLHVGVSDDRHQKRKPKCKLNAKRAGPLLVSSLFWIIGSKIAECRKRGNGESRPGEIA